MRQAILLTYASGQNAPSQPLRHIYELPDGREECADFLKAQFLEHAYDGAEADDLVVVDVPTEYGDITVYDPDAEIFLYATFIEQKAA